MGSDRADRSAEEGSASILAPWGRFKGGVDVNGSFTKDGEEQEW